MKKFIAIILVLIFCLSLTACGDREEKEAIRAQCDQFIEGYIGTHETYSTTYTVESIEYKIHDFYVDQLGDVNMEIVWYFEISGEFDPYKTLVYCMADAEEALAQTELNGYTLDPYYYNDGVGDTFTVVLNNTYARTLNDDFEGNEYISSPPLLSKASIGAGIGVLVFAIIALLFVVAYGFGTTPKSVGAILGGGAALIALILLACFSDREIAGTIGLLMIPLCVLVILVIIASHMRKRKENRLIEFSETCDELKNDKDARFSVIGKNYGFKNVKRAYKAYLKGCQLRIRRAKKEEKRMRDKDFSVLGVTAAIVLPLLIALVICLFAIPEFRSAAGTVPLTMWVWGLIMIPGGIFCLLAWIHYHVSGEARREAEEKQRRSEEMARMMASVMVSKAARGEDPVGAMLELSGYNKAVAEAEAREITNSAILGGAIGGAAGAIIGAQTAAENIRRRKGR